MGCRQRTKQKRLKTEQEGTEGQRRQERAREEGERAAASGCYPPANW